MTRGATTRRKLEKVAESVVKTSVIAHRGRRAAAGGGAAPARRGTAVGLKTTLKRAPGRARPEPTTAARETLKARGLTRGSATTVDRGSTKTGLLPGAGRRGGTLRGHGGGGNREAPSGRAAKGGGRGGRTGGRPGRAGPKK